MISLLLFIFVSEMKELCSMELHKPYNRYNDVKCDSIGRIIGWNIGSRQCFNVE